jgi:hypothetical protein
MVGVVIFAGLVILAFTRRLPPGSEGGALRVALLFFLLSAMVSGDIFTDRLTWGLLMLILLIDVPASVPNVVVGALADDAPSATRSLPATPATGL